VINALPSSLLVSQDDGYDGPNNDEICIEGLYRRKCHVRPFVA